MRNFYRFILLSLLVIGVPLASLVSLYLYLDPFKMVWHYETYAYPEPYRLSPMVNKAVIGVYNFQNNYANEKFNAFILGASISKNFTIEDWKEHLPDDARVFHFDASKETPRNLMLKVRYLLDQGVDLRYALIIACPWWFTWQDCTDPPYINPPQIDPEISTAYFQLSLFKGFIHRDFFRAYILSNLLGRKIKIGAVEAIYDVPYIIDPVTNEETIPSWEDSIHNHTHEFYARRKDTFGPPRIPYDALCGIENHPHYKTYIDSIANMLREAGTEYLVIMGPGLDKAYMNPKDLEVLEQAFGDRFFDFSKSFAYKSDIDTLFYDRGHYRYPLAKEMLDSAYKAHPLR